MRSLALAFVLVCGVLACFSSPASASVLFQDDFEGQTVGAALDSCTPPGGGSYAAVASNPNQFVVADAAAAPGPGAGNAGKFLYPVSATDNNFAVLSTAAQAASAGQVVTYSLDMYIPAGSGSWVAFGSYESTSGFTGNLFDLALRTDGTVTYYNNGDSILQTATGTFTTDAWVPVQIVADLSLGTYTANVGGVTFSDVLNSSATSVGTLYLATSVGGVAYDNLSLSTVPEPSTMLLLAAGLVGLLAYAWRKRK